MTVSLLNTQREVGLRGLGARGVPVDVADAEDALDERLAQVDVLDAVDVRRGRDLEQRSLDATAGEPQNAYPHAATSDGDLVTTPGAEASAA